MIASQRTLSLSRHYFGNIPVNIAGYVFVCARWRACQGTGSRYLDGRRNHNGNSILTYCRHLLPLLRFYRSVLCASDETDLCLGTFPFLYSAMFFENSCHLFEYLFKHLIMNHWTLELIFFVCGPQHILLFLVQWFCHWNIRRGRCSSTFQTDCTEVKTFLERYEALAALLLYFHIMTLPQKYTERLNRKSYDCFHS
jgi:hypothetical protein